MLFSTGEGKAREAEAKTTVYKRAVDVEYNLKLKASREAFNEINKKFPTFPFTLRYEISGKIQMMTIIKFCVIFYMIAKNESTVLIYIFL
jgi:hypothetical protein